MEKENLELSDAMTTAQAVRLLGKSYDRFRVYVQKGYIKEYTIEGTNIKRFSRKQISSLFTLKKLS